MTLDTMDGLLQALKRLRVETGGMACLGCGHERDCGVRGCAIIRKAVERLSGMPRADHSASTDKMVPLTLEQLREMDGQPVWIVEQPDWGHWELSEDADDYFSDRDPGLYGLTYPDPEGKGGIHKLGWIAYAYPPSHIDLQAWINVEDRLPEDEKPVLAYYGFYREEDDLGARFIGTLTYFSHDPDPHWQHESTCLFVTHWRPLPEPPAELEKRARGIEKDGT